MCQFKIMAHHRGPAQEGGAAAGVSSMLVAQHRVSVQVCGVSLCVSLGCNTGFSAQRLWRIIVCQFKCVAQHRVLQHSDPVSYDWRASMWYQCVHQHGIIGFRQRRTIVVSSFVLSAFVRAA
jgi:hypothetical protein